MPTQSILIKGKVQGVFFRANAKDKALELGITGWIENTDEGHVYVVATGFKQQLTQFVEWCHHGSPRSKVESVQVTDQPEQSFSSFTVHR